MSDLVQKPCPAPSPETAEYWAGARRRELMIQQCSACGRHQFYPRTLCTACSSRTLKWVRATGRGAIRSFTIVRRAVSEAYAAEVPYVVALVALAEGPTLMSGIVGCDPGAVRIGMPVEVAFEDWSETVTIPKFAPAT